ncbi:MAG: hypothetical protein LBR36_05775 [Bacteroidales bacterium]|nr:hypothetical protein [Bacteroidales bacterium]
MEIFLRRNYTVMRRTLLRLAETVRQKVTLVGCVMQSPDYQAFYPPPPTY